LTEAVRQADRAAKARQDKANLRQRGVTMRREMSLVRGGLALSLSLSLSLSFSLLIYLYKYYEQRGRTHDDLDQSI